MPCSTMYQSGFHARGGVMDLVGYDVGVHAVVVAFHVGKSSSWGLEWAWRSGQRFQGLFGQVMGEHCEL